MLWTVAETMGDLIHPSYHDIATMTKKIFNDAEEDIKEIGFKDSQSMMKAMSHLYICKFKLMYRSLKAEQSPNLSKKTQRVKGWYQAIRLKK